MGTFHFSCNWFKKFIVIFFLLGSNRSNKFAWCKNLHEGISEPACNMNFSFASSFDLAIALNLWTIISCGFSANWWHCSTFSHICLIYFSHWKMMYKKSFFFKSLNNSYIYCFPEMAIYILSKNNNLTQNVNLICMMMLSNEYVLKSWSYFRIAISSCMRNGTKEWERSSCLKLLTIDLWKQEVRNTKNEIAQTKNYLIFLFS